jgi:predicted transcriptional regulator
MLIRGRQRITFDIPPEDYQKVQEIATREDRSKGWVLRRAVKDLIRETEEANENNS